MWATSERMIQWFAWLHDLHHFEVRFQGLGKGTSISLRWPFDYLHFGSCPETWWTMPGSFWMISCNWKIGPNFWWTRHCNTWEFSNHTSPYATPMCEILLLGFCGSKVGPARKVLAVLAVGRCLSKCDGVWVCCFPWFAAQASRQHWFGAKWTLFWENFHRRDVITSQRWKASSLFWKDRAFVSLPFLTEIAVSMISIVHRLPHLERQIHSGRRLQILPDQFLKFNGRRA